MAVWLLGVGTVWGGLVTGMVRARDTGLPVEGAQVRLVPSGLVLVTRADGRYSFDGVAQGNYTLQVYHPGFETAGEAIFLEGDRAPVAFDFLLDPVLPELEAMTVAETVDEDILNRERERNADGTVAVLGGEELRDASNDSVADALGRVAGVSVNTEGGSATGVVIRGISPNLNKVTVDGQGMGGGRGRRTTQGAGSLSKIPPEFLERVVVTKAPTPDMDADAIGGTVDLRTAQASSLRGREVSARGSSRFDGLTELWTHQLNLTYGQPFKLEGKEQAAGMLLAVNLNQGERESFRLGTRGNWPERVSPGPEPWTGDKLRALKEVEISRSGGESSGLGMVLTLDYQPRRGDLWFVRFLANETENFSSRERSTVDFLSGKILELTPESGDFEDMQTRSSAGATDSTRRSANVVAGTRHRGPAWNWDASLGYSLATDWAPDQPQVDFGTRRDFSAEYRLAEPMLPDYALRTFGAGEKDFADPALYDFRRLQWTTLDSEDIEVAAQSNLGRRVEGADKPWSWKTGGKVRYRDTRDDVNTRIYNRAPTGFTLAEVAAEPLEARFDGRYAFAPMSDMEAMKAYFTEREGEFRKDETNSMVQSLVGDFSIQETIIAAYGMATLQWSEAVRMVGGLRMETTLTQATGYSIEDRNGDITVLERTTEQEYTRWLPGIHASWKVNPRMVARGSVTHTLARPDYRDLSPYRRVDYDDKQIRGGNPEIGPMESLNLDLGMDAFAGKAGSVSTGLFFKEIDDFIIDAIRQIEFLGESGWQEYSAINGEDARLVGFEMAWRGVFDYLPGWWGGLSCNINYTWTNSDAWLIVRPGETLRLPDQADHTGNFLLAWKGGPVRVQTEVQYRSKRFDDIIAPEVDSYNDHEYGLNVSASWQVREDVSLSLGVRNLTAFDRRSYHGTRDFLRSRAEEDWSGNLGFRWQL